MRTYYSNATWLTADTKRIVQALNEGGLQEVTYDEKKKTSRLTKALLETAQDMRRVGVLGAASHQKITLRHLVLKGLARSSHFSLCRCDGTRVLLPNLVASPPLRTPRKI
jgi:hypothetical protein